MQSAGGRENKSRDNQEDRYTNSNGCCLDIYEFPNAADQGNRSGPQGRGHTSNQRIQGNGIDDLPIFSEDSITKNRLQGATDGKWKFRIIKSQGKDQ